MPTTFANTINGNELLAKRSQCDYAGNDLQTTYATKSDVTTGLASKEDSANKAQSIDTSSTTDFPSSKATADFVNSSVATNTAKFLGNFTLTDLSLTYPATNAQIETALDGYAFSPAPTNNDYVYVEIQDPQTPGVTDVVKRFKFDGANWLYEYSLNNSSFTAAEIAAIDSGINSTKVTAYDVHVADTDIHVTLSDKSTWNGKQDAISDLNTIRSGASAGATAVQPGNLATVATTGAYSDLVGTPTIRNVPPVTPSDDNKVLKASYTGGVGRYSWEQESGGTVTDVEVDGVSVVSGGVAFITMPTDLVPTVTSNDDAKVLKASYTGGVGSYSWEAESGGGSVTDVEVDGTSVVSGGVASITMPTVDQTYDGTSTNAQSGTAVAEAIATKEDAFDVGTGLEMDTSGATPTLQVEAPVDIVAGPGIAIDNPDGNTLRVTNVGFPISETDAVRCGTFKNDPMFMKTYTFTGTAGTSETTINMTIDEKKGTGGVNRIWIDPSNSFVLYGSAGNNFLPISWRLSSGRQGSVGVLGASNGTLSCRCVDTSSTPLTFNITIRYTVSNS